MADFATKITSRFVMMTPLMAKAILDKNTRNRPLRKARIDRYAEEMAEGRWQQNGEPIIISDKDNLMNGQHRLYAVIKAGKPVPMMVVKGIDEGAFPTMDAGMIRTAGDVLGMRGVLNCNNVAAMARMTLNYRDEASIGRARTPSEIDEAVTKHPEIEKYASLYGSLSSIGRSVAVTVCMIADRFTDEDHSAKIAEFVQGVVTGADLSAFDPRLTYRNKMIAMNQDRQRRPEQSVVWYYTQRALSQHLEGAKIAKLSSQRGVKPYFSEIPSATHRMVSEKW